ncbi:hypothetical protein B0H21DRAFT_401445 [Amylocystis lapponica]|nr:hypothetical protein B0H21DRAFT_401445 [Amylocystis lapponica]
MASWRQTLPRHSNELLVDVSILVIYPCSLNHPLSPKPLRRCSSVLIMLPHLSSKHSNIGRTSETIALPTTSDADIEESNFDAPTWKAYLDLSFQVDSQFFDRLDRDLDCLLVFAALFSAIVTAFLIESYQDLQINPQDTTNDLLQQMISILVNNVSRELLEPPEEHFHPTASAIRVNSCWFVSLVLSVSTAFAAIIAKQWILELKNSLEPERQSVRRARMRQFCHDSAIKWQIYPLITFLPILLHISLLLFLFALVEFLRPINTIVSYCAAVPVYLTVVAYVVTHALSLLKLDCPYQTSLTTAIRLIFCRIVATFPTAALYGPLLRWRLLRDRRGFRVSKLSRHRMAGRIWTTILGLHNWWATLLKVARPYRDLYWLMAGRRIRYVLTHPDLMDARALSWLIGSSSRLEEIDKLTEQICNFPALVWHRQLFIGPNMACLVRQFLKTFPNGTKFDARLPSDRQELALRYTTTIARLNTEVAEDDIATAIPLEEGIPYHVDSGWRESPWVPLHMSGFWTSGDQANWKDTEDICFYANMLRLQVFNPAPQCSWTEIRNYSRHFHGWLRRPGTLSNLSDDKLIILVNTTIYTGMFGDDDDSESGLRARKKWRDNWFPNRDSADTAFRDHTAPLLDALSVIMVRRPDMGLSVRRQICWGLWALSGENYFVNSLVPLITDVSHLSPILAAYMPTMSNWPSLAHAVLAMLEGLLYDPGRWPTGFLMQPVETPVAEDGDFARLVPALIAKYDPFLKAFLQYLKEGKNVKIPCILPYLRRIVRISGCLAFVNNRSSALCQVFDSITPSTIRLLRYVSENIRGLFSDTTEDQNLDIRGISLVVYGCMCRLAVLQQQGPRADSEPPPDDFFVFDNFTARSLIDDFAALSLSNDEFMRERVRLLVDEGFVPVLRAPSHVEPETLAAVLTIISQLPGLCNIDELHARLFRLLVEPERGVEGLLSALAGEPPSTSRLSPHGSVRRRACGKQDPLCTVERAASAALAAVRGAHPQPAV